LERVFAVAKQRKITVYHRIKINKQSAPLEIKDLFCKNTNFRPGTRRPSLLRQSKIRDWANFNVRVQPARFICKADKPEWR
jgi:Ni/Co efflux regulator RcnB